MRFALAISVFLTVCTSTHAAQLLVEGSAVVPIINITPEKARAEAFERACTQALYSTGVEVSSATGRMTEEDQSGIYDQFASFTSSRATGLIVGTDILLDEQNFRDFGQGKQLVHEVKLVAHIEPTLGEPDPGFKIEMRLNKQTYRSMESLVMELRSTQDCNATIFNLYGNDSLRVIAPNVLLKQIHLVSGETTSIPPNGAHWDLPVSLSAGDTTAYEALMVVATKKAIPIVGLNGVNADGLISFGDAVLMVNRWLVEIPLDQRSSDWEFYRIVR